MLPSWECDCSSDAPAETGRTFHKRNFLVDLSKRSKFEEAKREKWHINYLFRLRSRIAGFFTFHVIAAHGTTTTTLRFRGALVLVLGQLGLKNEKPPSQ